MAEDTNPLAPLVVSVKEAQRIAAKGKTKIYEACAEGKLEAVKDGSKTLITVTSLHAYVAALPRATFRKPAPRRGVK